jgi:hypothetical protein
VPFSFDALTEETTRRGGINRWMSAYVVPLLTLGAGGALGALWNYRANRALERDKVLLQYGTTSNERLFTAGKAFAETARRLWHLTYEEDRVRADELEKLHEELRAGYPGVRLVGSAEVQEHARQIIRHAYAARKIASGEPDPREDEFAHDPRERLGGHVVRFLTAMRTQLGTPDAEAVPSPDQELLEAVPDAATR